MEEELSGRNLAAVERAHKSQVELTFLYPPPHFCFVHLLEVDAMIPDGEGSAWRGANNPVGVLFVDHLACQLAIRPFAKVPWKAVGLQGSDIEGI